MPIIFTRHLYIKDEVECALLSAILLNDKNVSLFWAFELFYSGFETEVFDFIWEVYYNFHASLNPSFEKYFIRKLSSKSIGRPHILASIVSNLCSKPYTTDVYILSRKPTSIVLLEPSFETWFKMRDYMSISNHIMHDTFDSSESNMDAIREIALKCHGIKWHRPMLLPSLNICLKMRFLSHIMQICISNVYLVSKKNRLNLSSCFIVPPPCPPQLNQDVLKTFCKYSINCSQTLHLFDLERHNEEDHLFVRIYRENWLSHCMQTPYWLQKIVEHNGAMNVETGAIEFSELDQEEQFYAKYGLEPDEQPWTIQCKSIEPIERNVGDSESEFRARFGTWNIAIY
jgi:hypothetical protein